MKMLNCRTRWNVVIYSEKMRSLWNSTNFFLFDVNKIMIALHFISFRVPPWVRVENSTVKLMRISCLILINPTRSSMSLFCMNIKWGSSSWWTREGSSEAQQVSQTQQPLSSQLKLPTRSLIQLSNFNIQSWQWNFNLCESTYRQNIFICDKMCFSSLGLFRYSA